MHMFGCCPITLKLHSPNIRWAPTLLALWKAVDLIDSADLQDLFPPFVWVKQMTEKKCLGYIPELKMEVK